MWIEINLHFRLEKLTVLYIITSIFLLLIRALLSDIYFFYLFIYIPNKIQHSEAQLTEPECQQSWI